MTTYGVARQAEQKVKPAFTVRKLEGTRAETRHIFHPKEKKIVAKQFDVPAGYLIQFAKGHSNVVSQVELDRILEKSGNVIELVDMTTGEVEGTISIDLEDE